MARRWPRRVLRACLVAAAVFAVAAAALPWWWPLAARAIPGVAIGGWSTSGWSRVELHDVTYEREGLRVTAASLRVPAFVQWPRPATGPVLEGRAVVLTPLPVQRSEPAPPPSVARILRDVQRAWPTVQSWVPSAQVDGLVIATSPHPVTLASVDWDGRRMAVAGAIPGREEQVRVEVSPRAEGGLDVAASLPDVDAELRGEARLVDERVDATASLRWRGNDAQLAGQFGPEGLMPANASIEAPAWTLPATLFGLQDYGDVTGTLRVRWNGEAFETGLTARTEPASSEGNRPPLAIDLQARGDLDTVRVETALVRLPGIEATLSSPLEISVRDRTPASAAEFTVAVDLGAVPQSPAVGTLSGHVAVTAGPQTPPSATFALTGESLGWRDATIAALDVRGSWQPAELQVERAAVQLDAEVGLEGSAVVDLAASRLVSAHVAGTVTGAAVRPWLAAFPEVGSVTVDATAEGEFTRLHHQGVVTWQALAGIPGGPVDGEISWEGEADATVTLQGTARSASGITAPFGGRVDRIDPETFAAHVTQLAWQDETGEWWHLAEPADVRVGRAGAVAIDSLTLAGEDLHVALRADLHWPASGQVELAGTGIDGARLAAFLPPDATRARLDQVNLEAAWDHGPVQGHGDVRVTYTPDPATPFTVESVFQSDAAPTTETPPGETPGAVTLGTLRVLDRSGVVLEGEGQLPFMLVGVREGFAAKLPREGAIALKLASTPNPAFWESVSRLTKWEIAAPRLAAEIDGTLGAPRGRIEFATATVQPPPGFGGAVEIPRIGDVSLNFAADDAGLALTRGVFTLDGNWVSLKGDAPWALWQAIRSGETAPWRRANFAFAADRMPMMLAARVAPTVLSGDGSVSFDLRHEAGRGYSGFLYLGDAALRPLPPVGTVRDIDGRIEIEGYRARVPQLSALVGGRPVDIAGSIDITQLTWPEFDFHLESARVPLVRQPGLVLRAGLDVHAVQTAGRPAHISGEVELGQSVLVSDLAAMVPTGGAVTTPEQRPPYFSVREAPLADWTLDLRLRGDEFLRIENPFFKGTLSADFRLEGTLREPRAIGRAWSEQGSIIFPFGSMRLEQAEVTLSPENPYEPALFATAATRLYGYDLRLEAGGTLDDPRLLFSSDPPLTSQEAFLLISTGALPDSEHRFTASERAQRLAFFVGRNLANSLLGKGGAADRDQLEIRSGEDFSREGGETIYVQYNLDGRWSVVAEKDRFDAYNGGIKFRIIDR